MATNDEIILMLQSAELQRAHDGKLLTDIHTVVFGNGEPRDGLVLRLAFVERFQAMVRKAIWIVVGALLTGGVAVLVFG